MVMTPTASGPDPPKWFYCGPDRESYGPYSGAEMTKWYNVGYFPDGLLIRTEFEGSFRPLADWRHLCGGGLPFNLGVRSLEELMAQISMAMAQRAAVSGGAAMTQIPPPMLMVHASHPPPPPPPPPAMTPTHHHYATAPPPAPSGPPPSLQFYQNCPPPPAPQMAQYMLPQMHSGGGVHRSQPPSEPNDGHSSASRTPESDNGEMLQYQYVAHSSAMGIQRCDATTWTEEMWLRPEMHDIGTDPLPSPGRRTVESQTLPRIISNQDASQLLTALFGEKVMIT